MAPAGAFSLLTQNTHMTTIGYNLQRVRNTLIHQVGFNSLKHRSIVLSGFDRAKKAFH